MISDDVIVDVITRTLEGPPAHTTQWTTRTMAFHTDERQLAQ